MDYKIRQLKTSDIFTMSKILKKMEITLDFNNEIEQTGGEFIFQIIENLYKAEDEASEFIGGLVGISAQEFKDLPLSETIKILNTIKGVKSISSFFKSAGQSMKQK